MEAERDFAPASAEKIAQNDATFRDANEGLADFAEEIGAEGRVPFFCECAEPTCKVLVRLTLGEYEEIRSDPTHFVNVPGHQVAAQGWAKVVADRDGYVVVQKLGRAAEVVIELDERDRGG